MADREEDLGRDSIVPAARLVPSQTFAGGRKSFAKLMKTRGVLMPNPRRQPDASGKSFRVDHRGDSRSIAMAPG